MAGILRTLSEQGAIGRHLGRLVLTGRYSGRRWAVNGRLSEEAPIRDATAL